MKLPPSLKMGQILTDGNDKYGQPNVSYRLLFTGTAEVINDLRVLQLGSEREILLRPLGEVQPPLETHDFPAEYVDSQVHTWRSAIFDLSSNKMTLSMNEPPAVILLRGVSNGSTTAVLHIKIEGLNSRFITGNALQNLHKLRFKTLLGLRSKTFYSTRPFPGFPCQALATVNGPIRLHDQIMSIGKQNHSANTWNVAETSNPAERADRTRFFTGHRAIYSSNKLRTPSNGYGGPSKIWHTSINLPINVPGDLLPTFCSALVSRQYSLIARIRIDGILNQNYVLEVPLQIVPSTDEPSSIGCQLLQNLPTSGDHEGSHALNRSESVRGLFENLEVMIDNRNLVTI